MSILKLQRKKRALTLSQLSVKLQTTASTLSRIESGKQIPRRELAHRIAGFFDEIKIVDLLDPPASP